MKGFVLAIAGVLVCGAQASAQCGPNGCTIGSRVVATNGVPVATSQHYGLATGATQCGPGGCTTGERIIAINGVPVSSDFQQGIVSGPVRTVGHAVHAVGRSVSGAVGRVVNRDAAAYAHAQREAQMLAARGTVGHPLGVAPGCRYSGTGTSFSPDQPNHCYADEMPESRLVARAMAHGRDGKVYWSAHYR